MRGKENKKIISIKAKLLGMMLPVIIVMVIVLVSISYKISSSSLTKVSENLLESSINNQHNEITAWLDENLESFKMVKRIIEGVNPSDEELQKILDQFTTFNSNYEQGIYVGSSEGNLIVGKGSSKVESDVVNSNWYKEGSTRVSLDYGHSYKNSNGENVITASGILNDNLDGVRIMAADITLDRISIIVNSNVEMNDAESFLIDLNDGTVLSHRDSKIVSTNINDNTNDKFLSNVASKIKNKDYKNCIIGDYSTAFKKINDTNWLLVSYIPTDIVLKEVTMVRNIMTIVSIICLIIIIVLIERTVHITINPVKKLTEAILKMAKGDFTVSVEETGNNEITLMSRSVNELIKSMNMMVKNIGNISENLNNQSESSEKISKEMNEASKIQSTSMKELNEVVDELVNSTEVIANNATELATFVSTTCEESNDVKVKMIETVQVSEKGRIDMEKINEAIQLISVSINELRNGLNEVGEASEEITSIVNLIGNISEETDLLSLNASIEAARAGEAGKGFSIVATEIGKLANTSKTAVNDISYLTENIRSLVDKVITTAGTSIENINDSNKHIIMALGTFETIYENIKESNSLIQDMVSKVKRVDDVASNVASISEEQAASAEIILNTSGIMLNEANNIARNSEEVAEDAEEIALISNELDKQIQLFKVN